MRDLSLPGNQDALVSAVAAANPHTIVVLETGGAVTMPWIGQVSAAMEAWYPGIRGGEAIANVLFGDVNPSAKLPLDVRQIGSRSAASATGQATAAAKRRGHGGVFPGLQRSIPEGSTSLTTKV